MKVTIRNLGVSPLSTELGLLGVGETRSFDLDPQSMYKSAKALKDLKDAGKISLTVEQETAKGDEFEAAMQGSVFVSAELTGNGSAQSTAHGFGVIPSKVMIALTGGPAAYTQPSIVEGTHTTTNVVATVTLNWKYRIYAWK